VTTEVSRIAFFMKFFAPLRRTTIKSKSFCISKSTWN